jgi:hypothetical protein
MVTLREQDILPAPRGCAASLPIAVSAQGCDEVENCCDAIAIGNYVTDHHYPSGDIALKPKSMRWGGRWTGTPFTIPYRCLVPMTMDGLLVCEKNISVSHIANGATRLQPLVLGIGQAAGMAAALCLKHHCQPRQLEPRSLQEALLMDAIAPVAVIPLLNLLPDDPDWLYWQRYYCDHPEAYSGNGCYPQNTLNLTSSAIQEINQQPKNPIPQTISGHFQRHDQQTYKIRITQPEPLRDTVLSLVTLHPEINQQLGTLTSESMITACGRTNLAGKWFLVEGFLR